MASTRLLAGVRAGWIVLLTVLATPSCGSSAAGLPNGVGRSCTSDTACRSGLVCLSQICVQPAAAGAGGGAGSGGVGGGAAGTGGRPCTPATTLLAPAGGLIADFMGADGGVNLGGGLFVYPSSGTAPGLDTTGGALHVTENQAATGAAQYVGAGLYFTSCIDASAFTGVEFSMSGAFSGCSMQFATGDVEHQDPALTPLFATGAPGAYPPQTSISMSDIAAAPQVVKVPFGPTEIPGNPATPVDPQKVVFVLWQLTIPPATPTDGAPADCTANLTIDDVTFY